MKALYNSQLMANQFSGELKTHDERMRSYVAVMHDLAKQLDKCEITRVPRHENTVADALTELDSTSDRCIKKVIPVEEIDSSNISLDVNFIEIDTRYCIIEKKNYIKRSISGPYIRCLGRAKADCFLSKIHDGECGNHTSGRTLTLKAKKTMLLLANNACK